jgi:DeoR/GlpR family transcriptional regulator of sugar metabolism
LIYDGDSIALDVGTTTLEVTRGLAGKRNLTVVTNCLQIANLLVDILSLEVDARLILTGGIVRLRELSMIGNIPEQVYQDFHVDKIVTEKGAPADIVEQIRKMGVEVILADM